MVSLLKLKSAKLLIYEELFSVPQKKCAANNRLLKTDLLKVTENRFSTPFVHCNLHITSVVQTNCLLFLLLFAQQTSKTALKALDHTSAFTSAVLCVVL